MRAACQSDHFIKVDTSATLIFVVFLPIRHHLFDFPEKVHTMSVFHCEEFNIQRGGHSMFKVQLGEKSGWKCECSSFMPIRVHSIASFRMVITFFYQILWLLHFCVLLSANLQNECCFMSELSISPCIECRLTVGLHAIDKLYVIFMNLRPFLMLVWQLNIELFQRAVVKERCKCCFKSWTAPLEVESMERQLRAD